MNVEAGQEIEETRIAGEAVAVAAEAGIAVAGEEGLAVAAPSGEDEIVTAIGKERRRRREVAKRRAPVLLAGGHNAPPSLRSRCQS